MTVTSLRPPNWRDGPDVVNHVLPACARCERDPRWFAPSSERPLIQSPDAAAELLVAMVRGSDRERCAALLVDTKHALLDQVTVSVGSVDHTFMSPREVYRDALLANASAIVVAHNHPSGDPEPSDDDVAVTERLARAGELVGISLLDHLVVGRQRWVSMARRGHC